VVYGAVNTGAVITNSYNEISGAATNKESQTQSFCEILFSFAIFGGE
jgi:hypothetical protein